MKFLDSITTYHLDQAIGIMLYNDEFFEFGPPLDPLKMDNFFQSKPVLLVYVSIGGKAPINGYWDSGFETDVNLPDTLFDAIDAAVYRWLEQYGKQHNL